MKSRIFNLFSITLLFILSGSCSKDEEVQTPVPIPIMSIRFTENFVPEQFPVIVFLSSPDGKNIIDTTCNSNIPYVLYPPSGKEVPEHFMVTIVRPAIFWHNLMVTITTYSAVAKGSDWTIRGTTPDTVGMATVSLVNVPSLSGPILYSNSGFSNETFNPTGRTALLYKSPDDLYVKIQTLSGQFYKITHGITRNGVYSVDMSDALQAENHAIAFPMSAVNYEAKLYGYKDAGYDDPLPILADNLISDGLPVSNINLFFPPAVFTGFHTQMMLQQTYTSDETFYYQAEGAIPDAFLKISASIAGMQPHAASVGISSAGTFNMAAAHWQFIDHSLMFYEWQVYAPDTTANIIVPEVPPAFTRMFPTIRTDSLSFQYAELTDFMNLSSYNELLGKLFDPLHPTRMDRYDATVIRKTLNTK